MVKKIVTLFVVGLATASMTLCVNNSIREQSVNSPAGFSAKSGELFFESQRLPYESINVSVSGMEINGYKGTPIIALEIEQDGISRQKIQEVKVTPEGRSLEPIVFRLPMKERVKTRNGRITLMDLNKQWQGCLAILSDAGVYARQCFTYQDGKATMQSKDGFR